MCLQLILEVNRLPVDFNAAYLRMGNTQGFDRILYARISGERVRYSLKTFFFGQKIIQASVKKEDCDRCQPWRAKRRLVVPSSREAALFSGVPWRQRENKAGLRTRRPVIWEPSTEQQRACEVVAQCLVTRTAGAPIGCQRLSRFWGLGCPKIYHEVEDTLDHRKTASAP